MFDKSSTAVKVNNTISRAKKYGDPVNVAGVVPAHSSAAGVSHNWPREFDQFIYSTRDCWRAMREFINNTAQSLMDTPQLTEATVVISIAAEWDHKGRTNFSRAGLRIRDNAGGMSGDTLRAAMQLGGTRRAVTEEETSFGRHGYGLKTATVQLSRGVDSLIHIATRQIGADTGYGFSYLEPGSSTIADMCAVQIYEDSNIFPAGTHGTEILIAGLSDLWPKNFENGHGTSMYKSTPYGCKKMTDSSTLVGSMAMRFGVDYASLLAGETREDPRELAPNEVCQWSSTAARKIKIGKQLHIIIEICDENWDVVVHPVDGALRFEVQPLFPAYETAVTKPGFELLTINLLTKNPGDPDGVRSGTLELGLMKKTSCYLPEDGIVPCEHDPRRAFNHPIVFDLCGLSLCTLTDTFPQIRSGSNLLESWGGRLLNARGFKTDTQKTGLLSSAATTHFMNELATVVKEKVKDWVAKEDDEKKKNDQFEAHFKERRLEQINDTPPLPGHSQASAVPEYPVRIKGLPTAEEIEAWLQQIISLLGLPFDRENRLKLFERRIRETENWLQAIAQHRFGYDAERTKSLLHELRDDNNCVGRADIATLPDISKVALPGMPEEEQNNLRRLLEELKAGIARGLDVMQVLKYMLFGGDANKTTSRILAQGFSQGSVALLCQLRILGFNIEPHTYESLSLRLSANVAPPLYDEPTTEDKLSDGALIPDATALKARKAKKPPKSRRRHGPKLVRE